MKPPPLGGGAFTLLVIAIFSLSEISNKNDDLVHNQNKLNLKNRELAESIAKTNKSINERLMDQANAYLEKGFFGDSASSYLGVVSSDEGTEDMISSAWRGIKYNSFSSHSVIKHSSSISCLSFGKDGDLLYVGGEDGKVMVVKSNTGEPIDTNLSMPSAILKLVRIEGSTSVMSMDQNNNCWVYNYFNDEVSNKLKLSNGKYALFDGNRKLLKIENEQLIICDTTTGKFINHLDGGREKYVGVWGDKSGRQIFIATENALFKFVPQSYNLEKILAIKMIGASLLVEKNGLLINREIAKTQKCAINYFPLQHIYPYLEIQSSYPLESIKLFSDDNIELVYADKNLLSIYLPHELRLKIYHIKEEAKLVREFTNVISIQQFADSSIGIAKTNGDWHEFDLRSLEQYSWNVHSLN